jgi:hypothetical protein
MQNSSYTHRIIEKLMFTDTEFYGEARKRVRF